MTEVFNWTYNITLLLLLLNITFCRLTKSHFEIMFFFLLLQVLAQEPERIEVVETEYDWWKPTISPEDNDMDEVKTHVELCVKSERSKTLWSHLSSPEKKKVCELIGYVEGAPRPDKSKQYIGKEFNVHIF